MTNKYEQYKSYLCVTKIDRNIDKWAEITVNNSETLNAYNFALQGDREFLFSPFDCACLSLSKNAFLPIKDAFSYIKTLLKY